MIKPEQMHAVYDLLRHWKPFRYKVSPADAIEFRVMKFRDRHGHLRYGDKAEWPRFGIDISMYHVTTVPRLLCVIGHEMAHILQILEGGEPAHNSRFNQIHGEVLRRTGIDIS